MGMRKKVILAVFMVPAALRTEPELQRRVILLRLPADSTLMSGSSGIALDILLELHSPFDLLGRHMDMAPGSEEEYHEIQQ